MEKEDAAPTTPAPMLCSNVWPAVNSSFPFGGCAAEAARLEALTYIPVPEWLESKESLKAKGCRIFQTLKSFLCLFWVCFVVCFGSVFGSVLGLFWVCFCLFWVCFESVLDTFWVFLTVFCGVFSEVF